MKKCLKYISVLVIILSAMIVFASCSSKPKVAETLEDIKFTVKMDGGDRDIRFWGDGKSTYYYFLPSGCGLDSVMVQTQNGITLRKEDEAEKEKTTYSNEDTLNGIECNSAYMLGCYDENRYLYEVPVIFMEGENLHSVFINTAGGTIEPVLQDKEQKIKGDMLIADADGKVVYQGNLTHIKGRGNGSWYSHKKPFNIKLSEKADLLGMGVSREWALINQEWDFSNMRNKIAYDLAADAGLAYSPDSEFVDLWIDGEYFGLYLFTDRITISEASVDITNLEKATEAVNMEKLSEYPLVQSEGDVYNSYSNIPNDPDDITGGYLLEVDKFYASDKEARFNTDRIYSVTLKSPECVSENQYHYIKSFVTEMENAIYDLSSTRYKDYIDVDSWVSMCVLQEIMANGDFMGSSQYFYKEADLDGKYSKLYAGPVWDMDLSLGGETKNALSFNVLQMPTTLWVDYLYKRPEFYEKIAATYAQIYHPLLDEWMDSKIDLFAEQLSASVAMNYTRWQSVAEEKLGTKEPFLPSVEKLKEYLGARVAFLDDMWINGTDYHAVRVTTDNKEYPYEDLYHRTAYMVADGEPLSQLNTPKSIEGYAFEGWYYGSPTNPGGPFDLQAPVTDDCDVYAKYVPLTQ